MPIRLRQSFAQRVENFRLLNRMLTQMERIAKTNNLDRLVKTVVEAARQSLVIGQL